MRSLQNCPIIICRIVVRGTSVVEAQNLDRNLIKTERHDASMQHKIQRINRMQR